jgi:aminoglycoside/choline kinase family phosphotransferase
MCWRPNQSLEGALYQAAVEVLLAVQAAAPPTGVPGLAPTDWAVAAAMATDWYAAAITGQRPDPGPFTRALAAALARHADGPRILILRDYHAGNLIWLPDRKGAARVGLLDFQQAQMGQPVYDLISLVQDARRDVGRANPGRLPGAVRRRRGPAGRGAGHRLQR